jgi:hypothetical protein
MNLPVSRLEPFSSASAYIFEILCLLVAVNSCTAVSFADTSVVHLVLPTGYRMYLGCARLATWYLFYLCIYPIYFIFSI